MNDVSEQSAIPHKRQITPTGEHPSKQIINLIHGVMPQIFIKTPFKNTIQRRP